MAFDPTPTEWLPNWSEDGTNITLPIASLPQLTAAEADAATGDIRDILFAILDKIGDVWDATAVADRPTKMTISRSNQVLNNGAQIRQSFTVTFDLDIGALDVAAEA